MVDGSVVVVAVAVDVLICVRNRRRTVERALDSVLEAVACADVAARITAVDGGSTDGTRELLAARSDVELVDQVGTGLAGARNQALAATDAPLVAWLDADDRWPADSLRVRLDALEPGETAPRGTGPCDTGPGGAGPGDTGAAVSGHRSGAVDLVIGRLTVEPVGPVAPAPDVR